MSLFRSYLFLFNILSLIFSPILVRLPLSSRSGVVTIRAFRRTRAFEAANSDLCERNISTFFLTRLVFRWASFRIDSVNALLLLSSSLFIVAAKGTLAPGLAGVALTQILRFVWGEGANA